MPDGLAVFVRSDGSSGPDSGVVIVQALPGATVAVTVIRSPGLTRSGALTLGALRPPPVGGVAAATAGAGDPGAVVATGAGVAAGGGVLPPPNAVEVRDAGGWTAVGCAATVVGGGDAGRGEIGVATWVAAGAGDGCGASAAAAGGEVGSGVSPTRAVAGGNVGCAAVAAGAASDTVGGTAAVSGPGDGGGGAALPPPAAPVAGWAGVGCRGAVTWG